MQLVYENPNGAVMRALEAEIKSAVIAHLHLELSGEREPAPETDDVVASTEQEAT